MARKRARTGMGQDVQSTRAIVRSELKKGSDLKYTDNSLNNSAISSTGTIYNVLGQLTRGDAGINNYDGNTVTPQGLTVKYSWNTNQTFNTLRVMCVQWFDAAIPVTTGILQSGTTNLVCLSPINITNREFIRVLYDKTIVIAPTAGGDTTPIGLGVNYGQFFISANRMKKIRYNASANNIQDGALYILLVSDDIAPTFPAINLYSRLSFYD